MREGEGERQGRAGEGPALLFGQIEPCLHDKYKLLEVSRTYDLLLFCQLLKFLKFADTFNTES